MNTFILALIIFGLAIFGMAIGVVISKKCLKRGCENTKVVMQNSGGHTCETCGRKI